MATRSRHGCATCRRRKKKCDERRPECGQCTSRGTRCGGYDMKLTWTNAVASRGHLMGSKLGATDAVTSKPAQTQGSPENAGNASRGSPSNVVAYSIGSQDSHQSAVRTRLPSHPGPDEPLLLNDDGKRDYLLRQCELIAAFLMNVAEVDFPPSSGRGHTSALRVDRQCKYRGGFQRPCAHV